MHSLKSILAFRLYVHLPDAYAVPNSCSTTWPLSLSKLYVTSASKARGQM